MKTTTKPFECGAAAPGTANIPERDASPSNGEGERTHRLALTITAEEQRQLLVFAGVILKEHRHELCDVAGDTIHETALRCGLLEKRLVKEPCGDACTCAELTDFPAECYFPTSLGVRALDATNSTSLSTEEKPTHT